MTQLNPDLLDKMQLYWQAANYLSVGQIYLMDNPLLKKPLTLSDIKPRLLGHFGTTPGLNFIYVHLNRIIKEYDLDMFYVTGPGHGGPGIVANTYLEGTYSKYYPNISEDEEGMKRLFKQFSFPGGIPSHVAPETPGSIHEGGELGYALSHAFGAAFDNPELIVACVIGDGEAETGPLATAWHSNKFLNPKTDGAVLPILHLNGYKIANPAVLARISHDELEKLFIGYGYKPYFVEGDDPKKMHLLMAETLDKVIKDIKEIQREARHENNKTRPFWPMIILRSPKGWTGPKEVDGKKVEGYWRSHQVPLSHLAEIPEHVKELEKWMKSYEPEKLFTENGSLRADLKELAPKGHRRMGDNLHTNGGILRKDLKLPDFREYRLNVPAPGAIQGEATRVMGSFLRDVMLFNREAKNFRLFGPDETSSNKLDAVFEVTGRTWYAEKIAADNDKDAHLELDGRVMEFLSEHTCQGWLEGYLLTGRHGFFSTYEAFVHIVDSMFNQHAKWLKVTSKEIPWRRPISSLNYLLTSHVWRQDHNGFSHQDPGFIDHAINKKASIIRAYFPPDANTLLCVTNECLKTTNCINIIVAGKQAQAQWLNMDEAIKHATAGIGIWTFASNDQKGEPDVVMGCCGDVPTMETLAAITILRRFIPEIKIRCVNVLNLMTLQTKDMHPQGLSESEFDSLFTLNTPVIFNYHGYPWLIHRLTYKRRSHENFHVRGYIEEGTTTTPFDMCVLNKIDRFNLVLDVIDRVERFQSRGAYLRQMVRDKLIEHKEYITKYGQDMPEVRDWTWSVNKPLNLDEIQIELPLKKGHVIT